MSSTDPDARLAGHVKAAAKMGYKAHYVVDGWQARVIVGALVTRADLQDNQPMLDLLWRTCFRWKLRPHHVTGDSVYGTLPNVKAVELAGIRAFMPIIDYTRGKRLFNKEEFAYDPERDVYVCPAGEVLKKDGVRFKQQITRYIADPDTCASCALKRAGAPTARAGGTCPAASTRNTTIGSGPTAGRSPTRRRRGSARCGSSRCSPRPKSGTG